MRIAVLFFTIPLFGFYKNYVPRFTRCIVPQTKLIQIRSFSHGLSAHGRVLSASRRNEIECTTNLLSLFALHSLHHMKAQDYHRYYNLDIIEKEYFKQCIDKRYQSHKTYLEAVYGTLEDN